MNEKFVEIYDKFISVLIGRNNYHVALQKVALLVIIF